MIWVNKDLKYSASFHDSIWKVRNYINSSFAEISALAVGKHDCSSISDGVFAIVSEYETRDNGILESHKKYVDLQMMLKGQERFEVSDISVLEVSEKYNEENDIMFWDGGIQADICLNEGNIIIFLPNEAHTPGLSINNEKCQVKKVVFKIPYAE